MKIALLPGDGIGPEIVAEAAKLLERLRREGLRIETETAPIGGAGYDTAGQPLPDATLKLAQAAEKSWHRLRGHDQLPKVICGVKFNDGIEVIRSQAQTAAA